MSRSSRNARFVASSAAFAFLLCACSGGSHSNTGGVLPAAITHARHALSSIRSAAQRIEEAKGAQSTARTAMQAVGSSDPATAEPPVSRPNETPCVVQLFSGFTFTNFSPHTFAYTPPACAGPWAKVVLDADFNVSAGRQYDRTASIWIAGTNVYFGTTAEPSRTFGPSWHVERDVTDLTPIFENASTGEIVLGNLVNSTYTGIISGSAKLEFYPATQTYPVADAPDAVYPLSNGPLGDNVNLGSPSNELASTFTLPTNVERAYLNVYLQAQYIDEFWYTCFPNDLAGALNNCGGTAFREGEVSIDGRPAGVAPVYPWIYTGGIDPYLWRPIPDIETLDFVPYRVDLTPFAAILSNGQPHSVAVSVFNDDNYFATNAALLLYLDHGSSQVTGELVSDQTQAAPQVSLNEGVTFDASGNASGPIDTSATHGVSLDGYVNTSHGSVETIVQQDVAFKNNQQVVSNATEFQQNIVQDTQVTSTVTTISGPGIRTDVRVQKDWPLTLDYLFAVNPDGSAAQTVSVTQGKVEQSATHSTAGGTPARTSLSYIDKSADTLNFYTDGTYAPSNRAATQQYTFSTNTGSCYSKTIAAKDGVLTSSTTGGC